MKKKLQLTCVALITFNFQLITHNSFSQNVGINNDGSNPDANTMLDIKSIGSTAATYGLKIKDSNGTNKLVLRSNGNLGINTSTPIMPLQVTGLVDRTTTNVGGAYITDTSSFASGVGGTIWFGGRYNGTNALAEYAYVAGVKSNATSGNFDGDLVLGTRTHGVSPTTERMRILANGNVGIGTATPLRGLHILGNNWASAEVALENNGVAPNAMSTGFRSNGIDMAKVEGYTANDVDGEIHFYIGTSGTLAQRMELTATGLGIGTPSTQQPQNLLDVEGGAVFGAGYAGTNVAPTNGILIQGQLGVGTTAPSAQLHTTGTVRFSGFAAGTLTTDASGNVTASSDERLKNIKGEYKRGIEDLKDINPVSYKWKKSTGYDTEQIYSGFSAQNIQENIPEAVGVDSQGYLTISDRPIIAALVNAINEQQLIIENQKDEIGDLKSEIIQQNQSMNLRINQLEELLKTVNK